MAEPDESFFQIHTFVYLAKGGDLPSTSPTLPSSPDCEQKLDTRHMLLLVWKIRRWVGPPEGQRPVGSDAGFCYPSIDSPREEALVHFRFFI